MNADSAEFKLKFDAKGLVPAIIQDANTKEVLMQAFMNQEAFDKTLQTGKCHFYSRSRRKQWLKGEESGHIQSVKKVFLDCDADCVLIQVDQKGGACHTGYKSCFFSEIDPKTGKVRTISQKVFDPKNIYK